MAVAHDASSSAVAGTILLSWTHTPAGTPRGALVRVAQGQDSTDQVTGVTYGGTAMTEVTGSPVLKAAGDELGAVYAYFLGSSVPTGAQTVEVAVNGTGSTKQAMATTVTAAADTTVEDTATADIATSDAPSVTLETSVETAIYGVCHSGVGGGANITPGADYSHEAEEDFGNNVAAWTRRTANAAAGSPVCNWTQVLEDIGILAVAIREAEAEPGEPSDSSQSRMLLGVG